MRFGSGEFGEKALTEGGVLWCAVSHAVVLSGVERHADEEGERHGCDAKRQVLRF